MDYKSKLYKQAQNLAIISPHTIEFWIDRLTEKKSLKLKIENGVELSPIEILDINFLNNYGVWDNE